MNSQYAHHILSNFHDTYYVIDVQTYEIVETNDPRYSTKSTCYNHIHNFEKPCHNSNIACPLFEAKQKKRDSRGIYDTNGVLKHIVSFFKVF